MKNNLQQLHQYIKHTNLQYSKYNEEQLTTIISNIRNKLIRNIPDIRKKRFVMVTSKYTKQANSLLDFL